MLAVETQRAGSAARFPVRDLIGALLGGDDEGAYQVAERVLGETGSRTAVFADLLHPAQLEIGNLWYSGRVSYVDEVRVAAAVRRVVCRLAPTPAARPVPPGPRSALPGPPATPPTPAMTMSILPLQDQGWTRE